MMSRSQNCRKNQVALGHAARVGPLKGTASTPAADSVPRTEKSSPANQRLRRAFLQMVCTPDYRAGEEGGIGSQPSAAHGKGGHGFPLGLKQSPIEGLVEPGCGGGRLFACRRGYELQLPSGDTTSQIGCQVRSKRMVDCGITVFAFRGGQTTECGQFCGSISVRGFCPGKP